MKWIKLSDETPKHFQNVLTTNGKEIIVTTFCNGKKANRVIPGIDNNKNYFVSLEDRTRTLNNVTHWMPLPKLPDNENDS